MTKKGFTLAEVLIAVLIIGIICALAVPIVIKKHQNKEIETKIKKVYTTFSNIVETLEIEHGDTSIWKIEHRSAQLFNDYLKQNLNVAQICSRADGLVYNRKGLCTWKYNGLNNSEVKYFYSAYDDGFILADGTSFIYYVFNKSPNHYANFAFDINGSLKGPNKYGKDLFLITIRFQQRPNVLFSGGTSKLSQVISQCGKNVVGNYCAELIKRNGWKVPTKQEYVKMGGEAKNYPW